MKSFEALTKWIRKSKLKVKQNQTKACLFYKRNITPMMLKIEEEFERNKGSGFRVANFLYTPIGVKQGVSVNVYVKQAIMSGGGEKR